MSHCFDVVLLCQFISKGKIGVSSRLSEDVERAPVVLGKIHSVFDSRWQVRLTEKWLRLHGIIYVQNWDLHWLWNAGQMQRAYSSICLLPALPCLRWTHQRRWIYAHDQPRLSLKNQINIFGISLSETLKDASPLSHIFFKKSFDWPTCTSRSWSPATRGSVICK